MKPGSSRTAPAQTAGADFAGHASGGAKDEPTAMVATRTPDASGSRSSLDPTFSSKSPNNLDPGHPALTPGSSPQIENIVLDPQTLHSGSSADNGNPTPISSVHALAAPSAAANTALPGGPAAGGSSSATVATPASIEISQQLARHVMRSIENGIHEIVLRLRPSELGDLTVRLAVTGHEVSAWFATQQAQAQQVIGEAIGQLQGNLGNAGYTLVGAWVGNDGTSQSDRRERPPALPPSRQADSAARELAPAMPISSSNMGVSIYV